jgi:B12-binding domain/radical SAM domain protein
MTLRVLALSAPQFQHGAVGSLGISSSDPASMYNACRWAAKLADDSVSAWGDSNWADGRKARRKSVLLMHSLEGALPALDEILNETQPNLVLMGAMTVCLPGAIAAARYIKAVRGDEVCIVLGGRHVTETMHRPKGGLEVIHHRGSPLPMMRDGRLEELFDIVVSGDGEYVCAEIGELVARTVRAGRPAADAKLELTDLADAPGRWVVGSVIHGAIRTVVGRGLAIDYDLLPPPCQMFGVGTQFDVFGVPTAHVFSDTGRGCIYDCAFCSERRSVTGLPQQLDGSARRLYRQLQAAAEVIREDHPSQGASAFCEDSTILGYAPARIRQLVELWEANPLPIRWGGQLTIDQLLSRPAQLSTLRAAGCEYLFLGLETFDPELVGGLSKDVGRGNWITRAEAACELIERNGMTCGVAVLFGLGESHKHRVALLDQLRRWRERFGFPDPVSLNWAVQHPLLGDDNGCGYEYIDWALPPGPPLELFRHFGEASIRYRIPGTPAPVLLEVADIVSMADHLRASGVNDSHLRASSRPAS